MQQIIVRSTVECSQEEKARDNKLMVFVRFVKIDLHSCWTNRTRTYTQKNVYT